LTAAGYAPGRVLGGGMEGVVAELDDDLVVKIWRTRGREELERLRSFYSAVDSSELTLDAPRIVGVVSAGDRYATIERRLRGRPLRDEMGARSYFIDDADVRCVVDVMAALRKATPTKAMSSLPILEGEPMFDGAGEFGGELADLIERRVRRFRAPLISAIADLDRVVDATVSRLREVSRVRPALIHGDLIPANILVNESSAPVAILDFGFLSTLGDSRFDAAIAASIYDMYGARARKNEAILNEALVAELGYDHRILQVYRAAYALVTSNCFSAAGTDGHFAWCVEMLQREDIRLALDL
jgi:aminoglycoside phosphotransferase (APT) family kinase protein